jgi:hypothetical protein
MMPNYLYAMRWVGRIRGVLTAYSHEAIPYAVVFPRDLYVES